jgi:hypothetical protein
MSYIFSSGSIHFKYVRMLTASSQGNNVRFQLLTATSMKMAVFWDVVTCSLIYINRRFRGALRPSETSVSNYQTAWRNAPQDSHLHRQHCCKLRWFIEMIFIDYECFRYCILTI